MYVLLLHNFIAIFMNLSFLTNLLRVLPSSYDLSSRDFVDHSIFSKTEKEMKDARKAAEAQLDIYKNRSVSAFQRESAI